MVMGTALTLIVVACAALIVWAFITGRVSAARRRTYLPGGDEAKQQPRTANPPQGEPPIEPGAGNSGD